MRGTASRGSIEQATDGREQSVGVARLDQDVVKTRFPCFLELSWLGIAGDRDGRNTPRGFLCPQRARDLRPREARQLEVHDDEVRPVKCGLGQPGFSIGRRQHVESRRSQVQVPNLQGVRIVVNNQDG